MELGIFSFGDVQRRDGQLGQTREAITNLLEAARLADKVGLDVFGVGEHHTEYFPASSPSTILAAVAATTKQIQLTSAVTVLSTDDPVRVYQQFATTDIISGGRTEIIAGRGSSTESFPLFGYDLADYDELYAEKLELLLQINASKDGKVTWSGQFRPPLDNIEIVPRATSPLKIWLATGGNPESSVRAAALGLPITYAIIGGQASRFAPLVDLYRRAADQFKIPGATVKVAIATPGYVGDDAAGAKETFWEAWGETMATLGKVRGFAAPTRAHYDSEASGDGALFVGSPDEIADRIIELHHKIGHSRHILQMDVGQLPQDKFLHAIELLGTKVAPIVKKAIKSLSRPIIGVIGAGRLGTAVARLATNAGYRVNIANSKSPESLRLIVSVLMPHVTPLTAADVIKTSDLIVLAIPFGHIKRLPTHLFADKTVIDAMNYWEPTEGRIPEYADSELSTSEIVQKYLPGAKVVKSLGHVAYNELEQHSLPAGASMRRAIALAGDDDEVKAVVKEFVNDLGFDPVDLGSLTNGRQFQPDTKLFNARFTAKQLQTLLES